MQKYKLKYSIVVTNDDKWFNTIIDKGSVFFIKMYDKGTWFEREMMIFPELELEIDFKYKINDNFCEKI